MSEQTRETTTRCHQPVTWLGETMRCMEKLPCPRHSVPEAPTRETPRCPDCGTLATWQREGWVCFSGECRRVEFISPPAPSPRPASAGETETDAVVREAKEGFCNCKFNRPDDRPCRRCKAILDLAARLAEAQREGEALVAGIEGVMRDLQSGTYAVPCADEAANHLVGVAEAAYHTPAALDFIIDTLVEMRARARAEGMLPATTVQEPAR